MLATADGTDAALLTAFARDGDGAAFGELVRRHGPVAHGVCRRLLADSAEADDAYQAALIVLARRAGEVRDPGRLGPWLYGVALRCARRAKGLTAARRARERPLTELPGRPVCDDWLDVRPVLDAEIERLPEKLRAALVLCELQGVDRASAAERLNIPTGTLSSRLARAKDALRAGLVRRGVTLSATALGAVLTEAQATAAPPAAASPSAAALTLAHMETAVFVTSGLGKALFALLTAAAVTAAAIGLLPADPPPKPPAAPEPAAVDKAKLLGTWRLSHCVRDGKEDAAVTAGGPRYATFEADRVTSDFAGPRGTYAVKPGANGLNAIEVDEQDLADGWVNSSLGVYRVDEVPRVGPQLTLNVVTGGRPRGGRPTGWVPPTDLESKPGGGSALFVFVRDPDADERRAVSGEWSVDSATLDGDAAKGRAAFGDAPTVTITPDTLAVGPRRYRLDLGVAATPRRIDLRPPAGSAPGSSDRFLAGIYTHSGDTLRMHFGTDKSGFARPADFTPGKPGTGHLLVVLKRRSAEAEKARLVGAWRATLIACGKAAPVAIDLAVARDDPMVITPDTVRQNATDAPRPYRVDPAADPKRLDITDAAGRTVACVYKLDGDTLTVHWPARPVPAAGADDARPKDFDPRSTPDGDTVVQVYRRADPAAAEKAKLLGEWFFVGLTVGGEKQDVVVPDSSHTLTFGPAGVSLRRGDPARAYALDPSADPKWIDVPGPGGEARTGIYKLEPDPANGDRLTVHWGAGGDRPADFTSRRTAAGATTVEVYARGHPGTLRHRELFRGDWEVVRAEVDGDGAAGAKWFPAGPGVRVTAEEFAAGTDRYRYGLDATSTPGDIELYEPNAPDPRLLGSYQLNDDRLSLHLLTPDAKRRGGLRSAALAEGTGGTGHLRVSLRRKPDPAAAAAAAEKAKLLGEWRVAKLDQNGVGSPAARKAVVGAAVFFAPAGDVSAAEATFTEPFRAVVGLGGAVPYAVDTAATPKRIDLAPPGGPPAPGVYKLDGETLTLHLPRTGAARPTDFNPAPDGGTTVLTLVRAVAAEEAKFAGEWRIAAETRDGKPTRLTVGRTATLTADTADFNGPGFAVANERFTLDPAATPKRIDFTHPDRPGTTAPGIYKFDGDTLTVHIAGHTPPTTDTAAVARARPKDFVAGAKTWLMVLQRADPTLVAAERAKLFGNWRVARVLRGDGPADPADVRQFVGQHNVVSFFGDGVLWAGVSRWELVPELEPRGIDLYVTENGAPRKRPGVYRLDGDTLTVHLPDPAKLGAMPRPAGVEPVRGTGSLLVTLQRLPRLSGTWRLTACVRDGKNDPDALNAPASEPFRVVVFTGADVQLPGHARATYIARTTTPDQPVTFELFEGQSKTRGVYKLDGDTLTIHARTGGAGVEPAAGFDPKPGGGTELFVMTRVRQTGGASGPPNAAAEPNPPAALGTLSGRVRVGGEPATAGRVTVYFGPGNTQFVGARLVGGTFRVERMPAGAYEVHVEAEAGGATRTHTETVPAPVTPGPVRVVRDFDLK